MKINRSTKWSEFAPFVNAERLAQLREIITDCADYDFWQMTIGDFSNMLTDGMPSVLKEKTESPEVTVWEVVEIFNACEKFLTDFGSHMKNFEIELTADEVAASSYMPDFLPIENLLIFTQKYFGLKNYGEAENITLIEYRIAKKASYSDAMFQKAIDNIRAKKMKRK